MDSQYLDNKDTYETVKSYYYQGLIPTIERNHHIFSKANIAWINKLSCFKNYGMSMKEMYEYINLAIATEQTIAPRAKILARMREQIEEEILKLNASLAYIDEKQEFYTRVQNGEIEYFSLLKKD